MKEIGFQEIVQAVKGLCMDANLYLPREVKDSFEKALREDPSPQARDVMAKLIENYRIAEEEKTPLCQDCGLAVFFVELGQDARITGGLLIDAINEGVRQGYKEGYLRKSAVWDPVFERKNTGDNTPAIIYTDVVPGDGLKISFAPKGGGSENMSALGMLKPAQGAKGIKEFVVRTVDNAGSNPCPPIVVGIGIGGTADKAMQLAKRAIFRDIGSKSPEPRFAQLEEEILAEINTLGIGPQGFGGITTALGVMIEAYPCHIASMPVGVNIQCHSARHKTAVL
jgi:fumarate hydratase subunit alpha